MENPNAQDARKELQNLQLEKEHNVVAAQKIVLRHLEGAI